MNRASEARAHVRGALEIVLMLAIIALVYDFLFVSVSITKDNMSPTLRAGQQVLVSRLPYRLARPQRGDIVAVTSQQNADGLTIHRVVGLPYERVTIRSGQVAINGRLLQEAYLSELRQRSIQDIAGDGEYRVAPGTYLLLNDNRASRDDSRSLGLLPAEAIVGRVWLIYWPLESLQLVNHQQPMPSTP